MYRVYLHSGENGKLYLVPIGNDNFNKYVWIASQSQYQFLGTTSIDLSGYQEKLTQGENITIVDNTISAIVPTETSELTNDSGFVTLNDIQGTFVNTTGDEMTGSLKTPQLTVGHRQSSNYGYGSLTNGSNNIASAVNSHAEGAGAEATGECSHAEGYGAEAVGYWSHAEGFETLANGEASHAEGEGTKATRRSQHTEGEYNIYDEVGSSNTRGNYINIVGNGTDNSNRSNAHTLDWEGNAWYAGDVYVGSQSGTNKDEGSQRLATEAEVNSVIDLLPTQEAEGNPIDLVKPAETSLIYFELLGNTKQASDPSPDVPQNIVSTTGDVTMVMSNKNIFKPLTFTRTSSGVSFTYNTDGSIKAVGTATGTALSMSSSQASAGGYLLELEAGQYTISGSVESLSIEVTNSTGTAIAESINGAGATFTLLSDTSVFVRAKVLTGVYVNKSVYPMLEVGNTATDYVIHEEKTQVIPLDTIQLRGFEGYRDRIYRREDGKWYKHKAILNYTITGNEGWTWTIFNDPTTDTPNTTEFHTNSTNLEIRNGFENMLCNKFKVHHPSTDTEFIYGTGNMICINIFNSRLSAITPEAFVEWLQSNPVEIVYASRLAEPDAEVSTTLRSALNATLRLAPYKDYSFFSGENTSCLPELIIEYVLEIAPATSIKLLKNQLDLKMNASSVVTSFWTGTQAQYDAIPTKDPTTLYLIQEA